MHLGRWAVLVGLMACQGGPAKVLGAESAPPAKGTGSNERAAAPPASAASTQNPSAPSTSSPYYAESDLRAMAAQVKPAKNRLLVCGEAPGKNCVCVEPLPCQSQGECITFQENVDKFRTALASKQKGRSVDCRRGEIGECGGFRYFDFEGDIERREMRWFDSSGRLVAQRNSTDYEEYCGGKARTRFQGRVPRCGPMKRTEIICGSAEGDLALPIEDVLKRRLKPTETGY